MQIPHFIFDLDQQRSAIKAEYVEEVLALPELLLIPNAPFSIVGVLDLRGEVLPVLDLRQRTESSSQRYQLSDKIIVVSQDQLRLGLIVSAVYEIRELSTQDITPDQGETPAWLNPDVSHLISGTMSGEETILMLSDPNHWFDSHEIQQFVSVTSFLVTEIHSQSSAQPESEEPAPNNLSATVETAFCPTATPEVQQAFRQRAEELRRSLDDEKQFEEETQSLVVIALNDRLFGIDFQMVREFITIRQATPIPCCPDHIIGNINLHGEILTVLDIGQFLNLTPKTISKDPKAVVCEFQETAVGVVVDSILDAMFSVKPDDIQPISETALDTASEHLQGVASYHDQPLYVLNLPTLLLGDELVVNANL
ncbi:chemotaxis protein CheW [Oscillatoria sp. CS-180]|uniref:chemotaxis protein CheW n=1 Tax=Oscillatoria sp. CS-180 TaxID=3021720 RepID=UPI00232D8C63|nr:chemotaxis protein CheW [Oscillatoria sp. CS-180]MDB9528304.1 chemotaxis protein CheW [Oscillatoria sp. CS-180]